MYLDFGSMVLEKESMGFREARRGGGVQSAVAEGLQQAQSVGGARTGEEGADVGTRSLDKRVRRRYWREKMRFRGVSGAKGGEIVWGLFEMLTGAWADGKGTGVGWWGKGHVGIKE